MARGQYWIQALNMDTEPRRRADLAWYLAVSTVLLAACGIAIICFGAWLGISPFLAS